MTRAPFTVTVEGRPAWRTPCAAEAMIACRVISITRAPAVLRRGGAVLGKWIGGRRLAMQESAT